MALSFDGYQARSVRFQQELDASVGQVLGATAEQALSEMPIPSIRRMFELSEAERSGARLDQQTARQRITDAGLDGRLSVPEEGMSDAALEILIQRKREEIRRQEVLSRSPGGFALGAAQLGTAFAASLLDPLNVGLAFVPVVGEARYLRYLANASGTIGRAGVRAGVGAIEGAAGAAIIEPLVYAAKTQEQADYDMQDSLLNVAFGTVFGGGLHTLAGGLAAASRAARGRPQIWQGLEGLIDDADVVLVRRFREDIASGRLMDRRDIDRILDTWTPQARKAVADALPPSDSAAARVADMPPAVRESALRTAVAQAMQGRAVEVEPIVFGRSLDSARAADAVDDPARVAVGDFERAAEPDAPSAARAVERTEQVGALGRLAEIDTRLNALREEQRALDRSAEKQRLFSDDDPAGTTPEKQEAQQRYAADQERVRQERDSLSRERDRIVSGEQEAQARIAAERQSSPESDVVADVRASEAADQQLAELPTGTDEVAIQESLLADEMAELQEVARIRDIDLTDELAEFDEAIELADTYSKAAKAAVLCGLGR